jgi:hypothetical protein
MLYYPIVMRQGTDVTLPRKPHTYSSIVYLFLKNEYLQFSHVTVIHSHIASNSGAVVISLVPSLPSSAFIFVLWAAVLVLQVHSFSNTICLEGLAEPAYNNQTVTVWSQEQEWHGAFLYEGKHNFVVNTCFLLVLMEFAIKYNLIAWYVYCSEKIKN